MAQQFVIGMTPDFKRQVRGPVEDYVKEMLQSEENIAYTWLADTGDEVVSREADQCDAILSLGVRYSAQSFEGLRRLALISRWGVGYDMIDIDACTAAGVALAIAPNGVRRPVAEGALTLTLALLKRLPDKDRATRAGKWRGDLTDLGHTTTGVVVGTIGMGNIGCEFMRLAGCFGFRRLLAHDPYVPPERARELGVELVSLETLLRESDVVAINCPLTEETRHLIGMAELAMMKPTAYLVNTARGAIVDQEALTRALQQKQIAGAGLDVLEQEPPDPTDPILGLDNVVFAPHAIAWSDELVYKLTREACQTCIDFARGDLPEHLVNPEVLNHPLFQAKLDRIRGIL